MKSWWRVSREVPSFKFELFFSSRSWKLSEGASELQGCIKHQKHAISAIAFTSCRKGIRGIV